MNFALSGRTERDALHIMAVYERLHTAVSAISLYAVSLVSVPVLRASSLVSVLASLVSVPVLRASSLVSVLASLVFVLVSRSARVEPRCELLAASFRPVWCRQ